MAPGNPGSDGDWQGLPSTMAAMKPKLIRLPSYGGPQWTRYAWEPPEADPDAIRGVTLS
jgi:hypothetical protein